MKKIKYLNRRTFFRKAGLSSFFIMLGAYFPFLKSKQDKLSGKTRIVSIHPSAVRRNNKGF